MDFLGRLDFLSLRCALVTFRAARPAPLFFGGVSQVGNKVWTGEGSSGGRKKRVV
jgi:hypothetical protein